MKNIFSLFTVLLLFQYAGYAQNEDKKTIDSLLAALPNAKDDTTKFNILEQVMYAHVYYKTEEGLAYQNETLELAKKTGSEHAFAIVKDRIGRLNWRLGNFSEALKNHFEALDLYAKTGDRKSRDYTLVEIGQDYLDDGKFAQAESYLLRSLKLSEEVANKRNMLIVYDILNYLYDTQGNIAEATKISYAELKLSEEIGTPKIIGNAANKLAQNFQRIGNNTEALKYFKQSLDIKKQLGDKFSQAYSNKSIADIYTGTGNFPEAMKYYTEALRLANEASDVEALADVQLAIGDLYEAEGKYDEAINSYLFAADKYRVLAHKQDLAYLYSKMGIAYTQLKKYKEAGSYFNDSKLLYAELNSKILMGEYYKGLALLNSETGNWKDAYEQYQQYIIIRDSSFNKETLKNLVASQMKYENDKKEAIVKAEQDKKDLRAEETIKRQRNIRNSAFAVLAVVLVFSIVAYRQRNKIAGEKKRSDLLVKDKELLIREIHHRVKNNLEVVSSLLALQSAQIDDPNTRDAMLEGQNRVHSIGIVHQKLYQGENLGAIEMKDYFINLSESILDSFGADKRVQVECAMEALNIDIDTAVPLGLIVNELLTNTLKYAFPDGRNGKVQIKLEKRTDGILQLHVSDNGVGKSGLTKGTGFGGQLISLLTKQLNGSMREEIDNGTSIFFEFKTGKAA